VGLWACGLVGMGMERRRAGGEGAWGEASTVAEEEGGPDCWVWSCRSLAELA
jgi:hypothetical protein